RGRDELEEIVRASGLGPDTGEAASAEWLAAHQRAGDTPVDVQVADQELLARPRDVAGATGKEPAGERVLARVGEGQGFVEVPRPQDGQHRPEDLLAGQAVLRADVPDDRRSDEVRPWLSCRVRQQRGRPFLLREREVLQ